MSGIYTDTATVSHLSYIYADFHEISQPLPGNYYKIKKIIHHRLSNIYVNFKKPLQGMAPTPPQNKCLLNACSPVVEAPSFELSL